ncbi:MAG TPA: hypothetical protein VK024_09510 [Actinomycetaceae bacterium]|nr:hypothetical protein [Actinomycetaceae bacterium]
MERRFRRPAMLDPQEAARIPDASDPATRSQLAYTTAAALVDRGRRDAGSDPELLDRLVAFVDDEGLEAIAELWSHSPARSLPGALWRLYVLREWVRQDPHTIAQRFELGYQRAEVSGVIAGVAQPPAPGDVRRTTDAVLAGVYEGDLDVALDRAAAFLLVVATGSALDADLMVDEAAGHDLTRRASTLTETATDLRAAAELWRTGDLQ